MKRKKVLFVYTNYASFVKTDDEILAGEFDVRHFCFQPVKGTIFTLREIIRQFFFLLFHIRTFDFVYIWFADLHSFIPVLFSKLAGKKSFLVIGGYDVCRMPSLRYGVFCSKTRGCTALWSMKNCHLNLPVSNHVARKVKAITRKNNFKTIYNCVNIPEDQTSNPGERKMVLTVGQINSERSYLLKGIDTFVEVARQLPELLFCIAGFDSQKLARLQKDFPPNVMVTGEIAHDQLSGLYLQSKVYCQLSRSESFGVALAEAMLMGCIPVVTNVGGMPEVVGDSRFVVKRDIAEIVRKIKLNMETKPVIAIKDLNSAILTGFSKKNRMENLFRVLFD